MRQIAYSSGLNLDGRIPLHFNYATLASDVFKHCFRSRLSSAATIKPLLHKSRSAFAFISSPY